MVILVVVETYGDAYPELAAKQSLIITTLQEEEAMFQSMLVRGERHLKQLIQTSKEGGESKVISGQDAFFLHDSMGFSVDLTELMALEYGYTVDHIGFESYMKEQKEKSRGNGNNKVFSFFSFCLLFFQM